MPNKEQDVQLQEQEVKLTEELVREYSSARADWAKQAVEDSEFKSGAQWTKEQVNKLKARNFSASDRKWFEPKEPYATYDRSFFGKKDKYCWVPFEDIEKL